MTVGMFPFGQPVHRVKQADRTPKRVFVLGVYASAVHARWCDAKGKQIVKALGVASEPYIFWRGEGVEDIVAAIDVPQEAGRLEPAVRNLNGPSGRSIDEDFLEPLGLTRADAWLCDLVPYSCMNRGQADAVRRAYAPLVEQLALPRENWPRPPDKYTNAARREDIAAELLESAAGVLITLGDQPLRWFATAFGGKRSLRSYGHDANTTADCMNWRSKAGRCGCCLWCIPDRQPAWGCTVRPGKPFTRPGQGESLRRCTADFSLWFHRCSRGQAQAARVIDGRREGALCDTCSGANLKPKSGDIRESGPFRPDSAKPSLRRNRRRPPTAHMSISDSTDSCAFSSSWHSMLTDRLIPIPQQPGPPDRVLAFRAALMRARELCGTS